MSWKAFRWAKEVSGLAPAEKFVLVLLADAYNPEWERAWPSPARLAELSGFSTSTVKRALKSLEERGLVKSERWMLNDGAEWLPSRYLLPRFAPKVRPAYEQPVLAYVRGFEDVWPGDGFLEVPGSNLVVDEESLSPDPLPEDGRWGR